MPIFFFKINSLVLRFWADKLRTQQQQTYRTEITAYRNILAWKYIPKWNTQKEPKLARWVPRKNGKQSRYTVLPFNLWANSVLIWISNIAKTHSLETWHCCHDANDTSLTLVINSRCLFWWLFLCMVIHLHPLLLFHVTTISWWPSTWPQTFSEVPCFIKVPVVMVTMARSHRERLPPS